MTPENGSAIVSNNTISQPESKVKSNTSNSQTTEKKSKGKTADDVYEKGKKLHAVDKVGEVTLVADESGAPVTPVLRASFDRTDIPSYIMAAVEASGDTALISALEDETAFMMMSKKIGENTELPLHDAIEELSEHVRDGNITPEQAAHILSEENAHHTGADVDTLVERENMAGVRYSLDSKNKNDYNVNKNGGIEHGSQDTERVAGGRVSTFDRSNNVLRKQSNGSREISVRMGDGGKGNKIEGIERHGSSGWLGELQRTTVSSLRGLFGNIRGIELKRLYTRYSMRFKR